MQEKAKRDEGMVPSPGVLAAYGWGWRKIWPTFWPLVGISILSFLMGLPVGITQAFLERNAEQANPTLGGGFYFSLIFILAYSFVVLIPMLASFQWVLLQVVRGEQIGIRDAFAAFERNYRQTIFLSIIVVVLSAVFTLGLVGLSIIIADFIIYLLLILLVILGSRLVFTYFLIVDYRELSAPDAIRANWTMTERHMGPLLLVLGLALPLVLLGDLVPILGPLFSSLWVNMSLASLYHSIEVHEGIPGVGKRKNEQLTYS